MSERTDTPADSSIVDGRAADGPAVGDQSDDPAAGAAGTPGSPAGPADRELPLDVVFGILKNSRRRLVLRYLTDVSETTTLSDLSEYVAAIENDKSVEALSSSERKRVYVGLYQGHLPRLDEADVVRFDDDRGTVTVGANLTQLVRYLDTDTDPEPERPRHVLAVAGAGALCLLLQQLVYPSAVVTGLLVAGLLGLFVGVTLDRTVLGDRWRLDEPVLGAEREEAK